MFLKFLQKQRLQFLTTKIPDNNFLSSVALETLTSKGNDTASVGQSSTQDLVVMQQFKGFTCTVSDIDARRRDYHHLIPPIKEKFFTDTELSYLREVYQVLYPSLNFTEVSRLYRECKKIKVNKEYTSLKARSQKSCAIAARWPGGWELTHKEKHHSESQGSLRT